MAQIPLVPLAVLSSASGILSHLGYFIRGEHHVEAPWYALAFVFSPIILFAYLTGSAGFSIIEAIRVTTVLFWAYVLSIWTSMLVYRGFFHRLGSYPGPFFARLSKFWHVSRVTKLDNHKQLDKLHAEFGDYVRTGPRELSIIDPEVVDLVHGPKSKCTKTTWYDCSLPLTSLHQMRDRSLHDKRRRGGWDRAFSMKSLRNYESRVESYADELIRQISSFSGKPINAARWFNWFSFDVMGDLAFGKSFDMLKNGESHYAISIFEENILPLGLLSPVPWLLYILGKTPGLGASIQIFLKWSEKCVEERKAMTVDEPDIMSYVLHSEPVYSDAHKEHLLLVGDSRLIIAAGSDTTSAALTYAFYHLAQDPSQVQKLRTELEGTPIDNDSSIQSLQHLDHLNGIINEALRLHPPVPGGVYRSTPSEGLQVGEHFIPGDVTVLTPSWSMHRSPKCYERPNEFVPERWYSKPDMIRHKSAFLTFAPGPYSCIGKQLALMELRTVIAKIVMTFDIDFAPGEDGTNLLNETKDCYTLIVADFFLTLKPRK